MKTFMYEEIVNYFCNEWPEDYYLADFILSWIVNYPHYYYNYNTPSFFSLQGKCSNMYCIYDFISCVANTKHAVFKKKYKNVTMALMCEGAPLILFNDVYCV